MVSPAKYMASTQSPTGRNSFETKQQHVEIEPTEIFEYPATQNHGQPTLDFSQCFVTGALPSIETVPMSSLSNFNRRSSQFFSPPHVYCPPPSPSQACYPSSSVSAFDRPFMYSGCSSLRQNYQCSNFEYAQKPVFPSTLGSSSAHDSTPSNLGSFPSIPLLPVDNPATMSLPSLRMGSPRTPHTPHPTDHSTSLLPGPNPLQLFVKHQVPSALQTPDCSRSRLHGGPSYPPQTSISVPGDLFVAHHQHLIAPSTPTVNLVSPQLNPLTLSNPTSVADQTTSLVDFTSFPMQQQQQTSSAACNPQFLFHPRQIPHPATSPHLQSSTRTPPLSPLIDGLYVANVSAVVGTPPTAALPQQTTPQHPLSMVSVPLQNAGLQQIPVMSSTSALSTPIGMSPMIPLSKTSVDINYIAANCQSQPSNKYSISSNSPVPLCPIITSATLMQPAHQTPQYISEYMFRGSSQTPGVSLAVAVSSPHLNSPQKTNHQLKDMGSTGETSTSNQYGFRLLKDLTNYSSTTSSIKLLSPQLSPNQRLPSGNGPHKTWVYSNDKMMDSFTSAATFNPDSHRYRPPTTYSSVLSTQYNDDSLPTERMILGSSNLYDRLHSASSLNGQSSGEEGLNNRTTLHGLETYDLISPPHDATSSLDTELHRHPPKPKVSNPARPQPTNFHSQQKTTVRLFVGRIPKWYSNKDLKALFESFGPVLECYVIRDRRAAQSQGCGFVRFSNIQVACKAIEVLNQNLSLDPELGPVQVKFATGELQRLGLPVSLQPGGDCVKVFFGNLTANTTEEELRQVFGAFGTFEELCVLRDKKKRSKCSGFVVYTSLDHANNAIAALNGRYYALGATRPLEVRLARSRASRHTSTRGTRCATTQIDNSAIYF